MTAIAIHFGGRIAGPSFAGVGYPSKGSHSIVTVFSDDLSVALGRPATRSQSREWLREI